MSETESERRGTLYRVYHRNGDAMRARGKTEAFSAEAAILALADAEGTWIAVPERNWTEEQVVQAPPEPPRFRIVRGSMTVEPMDEPLDASQVAADLLASGDVTVVTGEGSVVQGTFTVAGEEEGDGA